MGQLPDFSSQFINLTGQLQGQWLSTVFGAAQMLFRYLALYELFRIAMAGWLERTDLQSFTAAFIRGSMGILVFWALLVNAADWFPAIIRGFQVLGQHGSGLPGLSPGDIFARGLNLSWGLLTTSSFAAFMNNPASAVAGLFAAALILLAFVILSCVMVMVLVEAYIGLSAGMIFMGFGGSSWTRPWVESFIRYIISFGVKNFLVYLIISVAIKATDDWQAMILGAKNSANPGMTAWAVAGAAVVILVCCWQIPKIFAGILSGAPTLTGGDFMGAVTTIGAAAVGAAMLAGGALMGGRTAATAGASAGGGSNSGVGSVLPPWTPVQGGGGNGGGGGPLGGGTNGSGRTSPPAPASSRMGTRVRSSAGATVANEVRHGDQAAPPHPPPIGKADD